MHLFSAIDAVDNGNFLERWAFVVLQLLSLAWNLAPYIWSVLHNWGVAFVVVKNRFVRLLTMKPNQVTDLYATQDGAGNRESPYIEEDDMTARNEIF